MRLTLLVWLVPTVALADPCRRADKGAILLDGLLDDWRAVSQTDVGSGDGSFCWACVYDDDRLYLMVNVRDDRLLRTKEGPKSGEDHVLFHFGKTTLGIYPSSAEYGAPLITEFSDGRSTRKLEVKDSLQKKGWSVELAIPLASVPGWTKGTANVPFTVEVDDSDSNADHKIAHTETGGQSLDFEEAGALYGQFLSDLKLKPSDVTMDQTVDLDGDKTADRVVVAGKIIGVLSDGYAYLELPAADPKDVREVKLVDLFGDGSQAILARYLERGDGGAREVLAIYRMNGHSLDRVFAHELSKEAGPSKMTNTYELRAGKKRGKDLVIKIGTVTGFTQDTWNEEPADDMVPILLPWGQKKQETFHFQDGQVSGG